MELLLTKNGGIQHATSVSHRLLTHGSILHIPNRFDEHVCPDEEPHHYERPTHDLCLYRKYDTSNPMQREY